MIQEVLSTLIFNFKSDNEFSLKTKTKSWDLLDVLNTQLSYKHDINSSDILPLKYLIDSYNRLLSYSTGKLNLLSSSKELLEKILNETKTQIARNTVLLLNNGFSSEFNWSLNKSSLTPLLFARYVPIDFLILMINESKKMKPVFNLTNHSDDVFKSTFCPIINHIVLVMKTNSITFASNSDYLSPLFVLKELCEIKIEQTNPICNLVIYI